MSPQSEGSSPDVLAVCAGGLSPPTLLIHMILLGTNDKGSTVAFLERSLVVGMIRRFVLQSGGLHEIKLLVSTYKSIFSNIGWQSTDKTPVVWWR